MYPLSPAARALVAGALCAAASAGAQRIVTALTFVNTGPEVFHAVDIVVK